MADFHACMTIFLICMITILIRAFFISKRAKSHLPPSPFALPIIGHLHVLTHIPHQAFYKLSLRHGPVYRLFLGYVPCVVICSPEAAKEILKTNENSFLNRSQNNSALAYLTYGSRDFSFSNYGPYWKFMKQIVMSQLLNGATLDLFLKVRQDEINSFITSLSSIVKNGMAVDLAGELVKVSNNVITRMVMSERCSDNGSEAKEVRKLVGEITEVMGNFNVSDYIWLFKNVDLQGFGRRSKDIHGRFDALIERIIKEHEEARKLGTRQVKDLLDILLDIEQDKSLEIDLTRENIKALILCFDWKAGKDGILANVDMDEGPGLTLPRANPLICVPIARLDPLPSYM
ncbi:cytochrome P450 93A3 [Artemisia annua]|uniref:Cytochrome P450 93A3 n=1 Tax=Artemisia annua TaxID=35608 RepID=A0A2U1QHZ5_ARTAN|nr:cytochrome P450 93A3 [Artemisia annua]